ncbi:MAG: hypothetical protein ACPG7F_01190, partial [Aggregatilineales bacterium]
MPFPGAFTSDDLTKLQGDGHAASLFMAVTPNTIVFEALLSTISDRNSFAALPYNNVSTGSFNDIEVGMTVLVHTGEVGAPKFRGRVRTTPTNAIVYINETSIELEVGDTITVIDDFDLWARVPGPGGAFDWEATFTRIPPAVSGLQSVYVYHQTNGSISVDFAPVVTAVTKNATISSYLWTLPDTWTITAGNTTSKDITVTIPDGAYWMHFQATDSNGTTHTLHVQVFCGDAYTVSWVVPISDASGQGALEDGWSGNVTALDDVDDVLDSTRVTLFALDTYASLTGAVNTNIVLVGRWVSEAVAIETDTLYGAVSDVRYQIHGMAAQLAALDLPGVAFDDVNSPAAPGDVEDPTPPRAIWGLMTLYTTAGTLMSFDFLSAYHDYVALDLRTEASNALDAMNEIAWSITARLTFAPSGECRLRRDAVYLSTAARDALDTMIDLTTDDITRAPVNTTYGMQTGRIIGGAGVYNTTTKRFVGYDGSAPPVSYGAGQETQPLNGQILVADSTADDAIDELKLRIGNHLSAINPKPVMELDFAHGAWRSLVPSNYDWLTITLPASLNTRGLAYDTATRWLLTQLSWRFADFAFEVNGRLEQETVTAGAKVIARSIPSGTTWALPVLPPLPAYTGAFAPPADHNLPDDVENLSPEDMPSYPGVSMSPYEPYAPDESAQEAESQPGGECLETLNAWMHTGFTYSTAENSGNGTAYVLKISGEAQISDDSWVLDIDLTTSDGGFSGAFGTHTPGTGWVAANGGASRLIQITKSLGGSFTVDSMTIYFNFTKGEYKQTENNAQSIRVQSGASIVGSTTLSSTAALEGDGVQLSYSGAVTADTLAVILQTSEDQGESPEYSGSATFYRLVLTGRGSAPAGAEDGVLVEGDAFFSRYNDAAGGIPQA